jgi:hypothetical protein
MSDTGWKSPVGYEDNMLFQSGNALVATTYMLFLMIFYG